jgi:hypothetical protein
MKDYMPNFKHFWIYCKLKRAIFLRECKTYQLLFRFTRGEHNHCLSIYFCLRLYKTLIELTIEINAVLFLYKLFLPSNYLKNDL